MKKIILCLGLIFIMTGCSYTNNESKDNPLNKKNEENKSNPLSSEEKIKEKLCNIYSKEWSRGYIEFARVFKCGEYYRVISNVEDVGYSTFDKYAELVTSCQTPMEINQTKRNPLCDIDCTSEDICAPKGELYRKALETDDLNLCFTLIKDENRCKEELRLYQEQSKKSSEEKKLRELDNKLSETVRNNNTESCLEFSDNKYIFSCLAQIANRTKNEQLCERADKYATVKEKGFCQEIILADKMIKELPNSEEGIIKIAIDENNIDFCLGLFYWGDSMQDCRLELAKINNITYCERISRDIMSAYPQILDCYKFYGYELDKETYLKNSIQVKTNDVYKTSDADNDQDNLNDYLETVVYKTDPKNPDTDGDKILDGNEIKFGFDPLKFGNIQFIK